MKNKDMLINLFANIMLFSVNLLISFVLTPFIVERLGEAAYGFIGLLNNLVNYASIATVALNSMAGRFITIAYHRNEKEKATKYFSSVLYGNIFISLFLMLVSVVVLINLTSIINIPSDLERDVKVAFLLMSFEFTVGLISTVYGISTIVTNKLYLSSIKSMQASLIRIVVVCCLFFVFDPHIYFLSIATLIVAIFLLCANISFKKSLLKDIPVSMKYFEWNIVIKLIKSGIWNCLNQISSILNTGLSLLLTNVILGPNPMGILSIAKTIPNYFISFTGTIVHVFTPQMTIDYAKDSTEEIIGVVNKSVRILSLFAGVIFAFCVFYSYDFYKLWIPATSTILLYRLTMLSVIHMPITSGMNSLYNIFTVTNHVKTTGIVLFFNSLFNISITLVLALFFDGEQFLYILTGVSSVTALILFCCFTIPFAGYCLKLKKGVFYKQLFVCLKITSIILLIFYGVKLLIPLKSWVNLLSASVTSSIVSLVVILFLFWDREEIELLVNKIRRKNEKK